MTAESIANAIELPIPDLLGTAPADLIDRYGPELPRSAEPDARERAERIRAGFVSYFEVRQDIADAFARRDWETLGYDSWEHYLDREFGGLLHHLVRRQRVAAEQDMRSQGLSYRQIAERVHVDAKTVRNDLVQVGTSSPPEPPIVPAPAAPALAEPAQAPTPPKVTGRDGKQYPAKREPKPAEPTTQNERTEEKPVEPPAKQPAAPKAKVTDTPEARDAGARTAVRNAVQAFLPMVAGITPERFNEVADEELWLALTHCRDRFMEWTNAVFALRRRQSMHVVKGTD